MSHYLNEYRNNMLEKQDRGIGNTLLAALSAFQLLTADPAPSLAAIPKELKQVVPKGGFKEFLDKDDKGSLEETIALIRGIQRRIGEAVSKIRDAVERLKHLRKEFDEQVKDTLGGISEETLGEEMQKKLQGARKNMDTKILENEQRLKEAEEAAKEVQQTLDDAIKTFEKFDELKRERKQ